MKNKPKPPMDNDLVSLIGKLAKERNQLAREAAQQYAGEVEAILKSQSHDSRLIERCLDGMLDFCFDDQVLVLYRKLCRYYLDIDPKATISYVNAYRELWDEQEPGKREDWPSIRERASKRPGE